MLTINDLNLIKNTLESVIPCNHEILKKVNKEINEAKEYEGLCVWRFLWDFDRAGSIRGTFIASRQEVANSFGKNVYFGEVLGERSNIEGILEPFDIKLISDNPVLVKEYTPVGFNPLNCIDDD